MAAIIENEQMISDTSMTDDVWIIMFIKISVVTDNYRYIKFIVSNRGDASKYLSGLQRDGARSIAIRLLLVNVIII